MVKKFLLLGSCRLVNTISYEIGSNIILNKQDLWFTHYPDEHIQKVKHLFGINSIPFEHKEMFIRYEQQKHYNLDSGLRVADSIDEGKAQICNYNNTGTINIVVELPTTRYIKVNIEDELFWGHITSLDVIRNSSFKQSGGHYTDEQFLQSLNEFEELILDLVSSCKIAEDVRFIYVPNSPFIELKDQGWGISEKRVHIFNLIRKHCSKSVDLANRCYFDVKAMIEENGGPDKILKDQFHYTLKGRKTAFKYLEKLSK